jgi:uncharacterized protein (DUF433 family)
MLLELLSSGMTTEEILDDYEDLKQEDLLAVLQLLTPAIPDIVREFQAHSFLELGRSGIIVRG